MSERSTLKPPTTPCVPTVLPVPMPFPLPTPTHLHWLAAGQLGNRLGRTVRWWVMLNYLYGTQQGWAHLPQPFRYGDLRDRLFSRQHPKADTLNAQAMLTACPHPQCLCQRTLGELIATALPQTDPERWLTEVAALTGRSRSLLDAEWASRPFATVHRSLRADVRMLADHNWLIAEQQGRFSPRHPTDLPQPPTVDTVTAAHRLDTLTPQDATLLLRVLEDIAFVQPQLHVLLERLWQQTTQSAPSRTPPTKRIFLHLDYNLPDTTQDRVDGYQDQLERLWQTADGGVVQFDYWQARTATRSRITVYPVCLHYVRRAKYLSAYGPTPTGHFGWHNYRLDRITDDQLTLLPWGDPAIPHVLKQLRHEGQLPTPADVQAALDAAWGFNFYEARERLILRFTPEFARWYVDDTDRHPTFEPVAYTDLPATIARDIPDRDHQAQLHQILAQCNPHDRYYQAWMRVPDINITMRLRDWRSNGEVIAPLPVRQQMLQEAQQELAFYTNPS